MADRKITQFPRQTAFTGNDLIPTVDDTLGTPTNKAATLNALFGAIPSNTVFASTKGPVVNAGKITLVANTVVTSNSASSVFGSNAKGTIAWDENYLYIAISNTVIKRIPLQVFS